MYDNSNIVFTFIFRSDVLFGFTVILLVLPVTSNFPIQNPLLSKLVNAGCVKYSPTLLPFDTLVSLFSNTISIVSGLLELSGFPSI